MRLSLVKFYIYQSYETPVNPHHQPQELGRASGTFALLCLRSHAAQPAMSTSSSPPIPQLLIRTPPLTAALLQLQ